MQLPIGTNIFMTIIIVLIPFIMHPANGQRGLTAAPALQRLKMVSHQQRLLMPTAML